MKPVLYWFYLLWLDFTTLFLFMIFSYGAFMMHHLIESRSLTSYMLSREERTVPEEEGGYELIIMILL